MTDAPQFVPAKLPHRHTVLLAMRPFHFEALRLGVTLVDGNGWHAVYAMPAMGQFELEHGLEDQRFSYNHRCMVEAAARKGPVVGQHAGFSDLFVPVVGLRGAEAMLVTGPFRTGSPTSAEIRERWHWLTGSQGHLGDPEFASYVAMSLATPVFDGPRLEALKRLMLCLAQLIAGTGDAEALARDMAAADADLDEATFEHRMWEVVRTLVDPRTSRVWASHYQRPRRVALGLHRIPETAVVGLVAGRYDEVDPVDEVVRRCEFQRACLRLARARVDVASGPVGDHGVVFLAPAERSDQATRAKLVELGERAVVLARRQFALRLHVGTSTATGSASLPVRYQAALAAAEKALSQGVRLVHASALTGPAEHAVRDLRAELARAVDEPTSKLTARFDRYLDIVAVHSGYRMEPTRVHLDAGFERLASPFVVSGALDQETFDDLCGVLDRAAESASTLRDLFFAYRTAVADLVQALDRPTRARRERSLRRAVQFIREHVAEPIRLKAVARVAGFEPHYFSRLFRERENVTFEKFVTERRIERAKQMLWRTSLGIERIGQLSGFASSTYFHRVFKRVVGETPLEYRKRPT